MVETFVFVDYDVGTSRGTTPSASANLLGFTMEPPLLLKFCLNNHENLDYTS
jgi:hypothetical protein